MRYRAKEATTPVAIIIFRNQFSSVPSKSFCFIEFMVQPHKFQKLQIFFSEKSKHLLEFDAKLHEFRESSSEVIEERLFIFGIEIHILAELLVFTQPEV